MRSILFLISFLIAELHVYAQTVPFAPTEIPVVMINDHVSLHFVSPEPIRYVDIASNDIAGDLPLENVLRLRIKNDSTGHTPPGFQSCAVTVIGESFVAQYRLLNNSEVNIPALINIMQEHTKPLTVPGITLTTPQLKKHALAILERRGRDTQRKTKFARMQVSLNKLYTVDDLIFMDLSFRNQTNLPYDIDELRFTIEDRKINKATNVQSVEIKPLWQLYPDTRFKREFRNIYVLKKITFPQDKILNLSISEKQMSGRSLSLQIKYKDVLKADTF